MNLLEKVGLPINDKKVQKPGQQVICLGIEINAKTSVLKIPENKMAEVRDMCHKWSTRTYASKRQLQKLTGKLLYIHRCVRPARLFVNRILSLLRSTPMRGTSNFLSPSIRISYGGRSVPDVHRHHHAPLAFA